MGRWRRDFGCRCSRGTLAWWQSWWAATHSRAMGGGLGRQGWNRKTAGYGCSQAFCWLWRWDQWALDHAFCQGLEAEALYWWWRPKSTLDEEKPLCGKRICQWEERWRLCTNYRSPLKQLVVGQFSSVGWCCKRSRCFLQTLAGFNGHWWCVFTGWPRTSSQMRASRMWICHPQETSLDKDLGHGPGTGTSETISRNKSSMNFAMSSRAWVEQRIQWSSFMWTTSCTLAVQISLRSSFYQVVKTVSLSNGMHCKSLAAQSRFWRRRSLWGISWHSSSQSGWSFWGPFWCSSWTVDPMWCLNSTWGRISWTDSNRCCSFQKGCRYVPLLESGSSRHHILCQGDFRQDVTSDIHQPPTFEEAHRAPQEDGRPGNFLAASAAWSRKVANFLGEVLDFGVLQWRWLGIKQSPSQIHKLWSSSPQWMPFICIIKDTSSCESELYSIVSTMGDAIFIRRCLEFILRVDISQVHFTDSSSARQLCNRQGVGKIRHLSGKVLWVQSQVQSGEVEMVQMPTAYNVGQKPWKEKTSCIDGWTWNGVCRNRPSNRPGGAWRFAVKPHQFTWCHKTCKNDSQVDNSCGPWANWFKCTGPMWWPQCEQWWQRNIVDLALNLFACCGMALVLQWLPTNFGWGWIKEWHTMSSNRQKLTRSWATRRDLLNEQSANLQEFRTRYNNYVRQTDQGLATLEEYVDCVHDGLVHYGGLVRFNELTLQQRSDMFAQERSNQLLFRARQVAPDTTDDPSGPGIYASEAAGSSKLPASVAAAAPFAVEDNQVESMEEEEPTSDAEELENDSNTREGELTRIIRHLPDQVNQALAFEHFEDATDIQTTLTTVLEAARFSPHLTLDIARRVTGTYQRLFRRART